MLSLSFMKILCVTTTLYIISHINKVPEGFEFFMSAEYIATKKFKTTVDNMKSQEICVSIVIMEI